MREKPDTKMHERTRKKAGTEEHEGHGLALPYGGIADPVNGSVSFVSLALSFLFGLFGMAYFVYGKKQGELVPMLAGGVLCFYPYFVANLTLMVIVGVALMAAPFVAAKFGW